MPTILREGPELAIHTLVWCDTVANLDRTFDRRTLRAFDMRVALQMPTQDSTHLIGSPLANSLGPHRCLFYSEEEGKLEKFRPYRLPSREWLAQAGARLADRSGAGVDGRV